MKKRTIRVQFFAALALYTLINYLLISVALLSFDVYEYRENPALLYEEAEEILVVIVVMTVLFPLSLLAAWGVSRWLLRPWRSMVEQAERIGSGQLDERIEAVNASDEIGRLAATLNQAFDRYRDLLARMQRFNYDASHQLRNPLAAIRTRSEVCLMHPRSEDEYREVIESMLDNTIRLSRTVDKLLLLARATGGALDDHREPVCLQDMAEEILREGRMVGEVRDLSINLTAPDKELIIGGVPDLIREAMANLVDNALKFTPSGGEIEIVLRELSPDRIRVEVRDSGPGLAPAQKIMIFRPFKQANAAHKEGAGLGLALVADICRVHGGTFGVEDTPSGGCCFWMEFARSR